MHGLSRPTTQDGEIEAARGRLAGRRLPVVSGKIMETIKVPKGIIRFEQGNTRAWWVRIKRERAVFRKLFSDGVYGSPALALEKAIEYLNELKQTFPRSRKQFSNIGRKRETGPIPGVRRTISTRKGHKYGTWIAAWSPERGVHKTKRFGVLKYGEEGAMRLAIEHRQSELQKIKDLFPDAYELQMKEIPVELINSGALAFTPSKQTIKTPTTSEGNNPPDLVADVFAYEGETKYSLHLEIERSTKLRNTKVAEFSKKHGRVFCELCHTNLKSKYPFLVKDFIEVHHIVPLSELSDTSYNSLDDLMLLCPNCHKAVHQGDAQNNLLEAMLLFGRNFT